MAIETMTTTTTAKCAWTQQYAQVVAGTKSNATTATTTSSTTSAPSVRQFLENVLAARSSEPQLAIADIGEQLRVPLADLSTAKLQKEQGLDRDAVLRVLQLQVIARLCACCCRKSKSKSKKQRAIAAKQSKQALKATKKEVRSLLDRIALLLDAANPPSLTDDDERSPFHEFLQDVLARAFTAHVPKFVAFLLGVYELADESQELEKLSLSALPAAVVASVVKPVDAQTPAPADAVAVAAQSILSALKDEQRPLKRSRTETAVPFKKMDLPHELRRRSSFPSTRRDLAKAVTTAGTGAPSSTVAAPPAAPARLPRSTSSSSSRRSSSSTSGAPPLARSSITSSSATSKPSSKPRRSVSTGVKAAQVPLLPTSADKPRLAHHSSLGARLRPPAPLLVRDMDRTLVAGPQSRFTPSATNRMPHTLVSASSAPAPRPLLAGLTRSTSLGVPKPPAVAVPPRTAVSSLLAREPSATSVVMRTPDRPQRRAHRAARVLIESSPPFRNPNASARPRKSPSAIPPPLLR